MANRWGNSGKSGRLYFWGLQNHCRWWLYQFFYFTYGNVYVSMLLSQFIPSYLGGDFLEKTLESPLDCKEIQLVHPKGNRSWIFIGMTDAEDETPILWPPDAKNWLIRKEPDAGKDWRQEEKGTTEDEMVGWHHWLNGHEFEQALGVGDGQGSPTCCSPWGHKELDRTEWLNWTDAE